MAKYTRDQIIELLRAAGVPEADIPTMVGIALAESNGNTDAQGDQKLANDKWGNSVGLFQIRSLRDPSKYKGVDSLRDAAKLEDPVFNAKAAWAISKQGKDFTPWTTFNEGTYQKYMDGTSTPSRGRGPKVFKGKGKVLGNLDNIFGTPDDEDVISLSFLNTLAELSGLNYLVADLNLEAEAEGLDQVFIDAGAEYNEKQIADLANKAALFKLKKEDFVKIVADSVDFQSSYLRGLANSYATGVRKTAASYGITLPDGSKELKNFVKAKFTGAMSDTDIDAVFKEEAIKAFPNYKARFEAGATLDDVAKPFKKDIADTLELSEEDVSYSDEVLKSVLTATNPKDGSPYAMSRAEVVKLAMNDKRFDSTKKAQDMLTTPLLQLVYGRY